MKQEKSAKLYQTYEENMFKRPPLVLKRYRSPLKAISDNEGKLKTLTQ
jgi:hypothetical protein